MGLFSSKKSTSVSETNLVTTTQTFDQRTAGGSGTTVGPGATLVQTPAEAFDVASEAVDKNSDVVGEAIDFTEALGGRIFDLGAEALALARAAGERSSEERVQTVEAIKALAERKQVSEGGAVLESAFRLAIPAALVFGGVALLRGRL